MENENNEMWNISAGVASVVLIIYSSWQLNYTNKLLIEHGSKNDDEFHAVCSITRKDARAMHGLAMFLLIVAISLMVSTAPSLFRRLLSNPASGLIFTILLLSAASYSLALIHKNKCKEHGGQALQQFSIFAVVMTSLMLVAAAIVLKYKN